MEQTGVFTHKLDLALRLVDTTSGRNVSGIGTEIRISGERVHFERKPDNVLIFRNLAEKAFSMEIISPDFETVEETVDLDSFGGKLPLIELDMIPKESSFPHGTFFSLCGKIPGIRSICAVRDGDSSVMMREFDVRRRMATIFNPHRLSLDRTNYALVNPDVNEFELFRIEKMSGNDTLKLDRQLVTEVKNYFGITPVVFGSVRDDGSYTLRVRNDSENAKWIIRLESADGVIFRTVNLKEDENPPLEGGA